MDLVEQGSLILVLMLAFITLKFSLPWIVRKSGLAPDLQHGVTSPTPKIASQPEGVHRIQEDQPPLLVPLVHSRRMYRRSGDSGAWRSE